MPEAADDAASVGRSTSDVPASVDVAVVGGGPAGICAAVAASRMGAQTLLVERNGYLGGMATASLVNPIYGFGYFEPGRQLVAGIAEDVVQHLRQIDGGTLGHRRREECGTCDSPERCRASGISSLLPFEPEALKLAAYRLASDAGVELLHYCLVDEAVVQDGHVQGVRVSSKNGRRLIRAAVTIDATGDGDVAASAGVPFEFGISPGRLVQPQSLMFRIAGVNHDADRLCFNVEPAVEGVSRFLLFRLPRAGEYVVNCDTGLFGLDPLEPRDLTKAHTRAMVAAFSLVGWIRENVEGCEQCHLVSTAPQLGVRESRRIQGDYVLTKEDVLGLRRFPDGIARGCFPLDIHVLTDSPDAKNPLTPLPCGQYYEIPYRCLLPRDVEGLLIAGRCISGTHEAHASYRVMATCMALGQAAGTAAALAVSHHLTPRTLDAGLLRSTLRKHGVLLD